ncbi:MAG: hypothetical protein ACTSO2_05695 [Promethearchaeota archaeon]
MHEIYLSIIGLAIFGIVSAYTGLKGGIWLWRVLKSVPIFRKIQKYVNLIAIIGLISISFLIGLMLWNFLNPIQISTELDRKINILISTLQFSIAYLLGYDLSIIIPLRNNEKELTSSSLIGDFNFKLYGKRIIIVFFLTYLLSIIIYIINLVFAFIQLNNEMYLVLPLSFALGYLFWEHLKQTLIIKGQFKIKLIGLSLLTTLIVISLLIYSYFAKNSGNETKIKAIFALTALFFHWMFWYFVGLCYEILFDKKQ